MERSGGFASKLKSFVNSNQNSILTIAGVLLGLVSGIAVKRVVWPDQLIDPHLLRFISLPGILYIRAFLLLIIPLLIVSLSTSLISKEESKNDAKNDENKNDPKDDEDEEIQNQMIAEDDINPQHLLLATLAFFATFAIIGTTISISLMHFFQPGMRSSDQSTDTIEANQIWTTKDYLIENRKKLIEQKSYQSDSFYNILLNVFPNNLILPLFATSYVQAKIEWPANLTEILDPAYVPQSTQQTINNFKPNMIGICTISFLLGLLLRKLGPQKTQSIRHLLAEVNLLVDESFRVLIRMMPVGMFVWMFSEGLKMRSIAHVATQLTQFYALVTVIFSFWWIVFWPIVLAVFARENAFRLYRRVTPAILVAIGTTSSAITLPVTIRCMESGDNNGLPKIFSRTILPLGMTVHMNGVSIFYPMVAMFVAQMKGIELNAMHLFALGFFTFAISVGVPGSPSGGANVIIFIASAAVLGIDDPQDVLAFLLPFEIICERLRTSTNIVGDCVVSRCVCKMMITSKEITKVEKREISLL